MDKKHRWRTCKRKPYEQIRFMTMLKWIQVKVKARKHKTKKWKQQITRQVMQLVNVWLDEPLYHSFLIVRMLFHNDIYRRHQNILQLLHAPSHAICTHHVLMVLLEHHRLHEKCHCEHVSVIKSNLCIMMLIIKIVMMRVM